VWFVTLISFNSPSFRLDGGCEKTAGCHSGDGFTLASVPVRVFRGKVEVIRGKRIDS